MYPFRRLRMYIDQNRKSPLYKVLKPLKHRVRIEKERGVFYFPEFDLFFYHIPKCGGTSVYNSLGRDGFVRMKAKEVPRYSKKITIVRDPFERLVSSYHYLMKDTHFRKKFNMRKEATFKEFCLMVLHTSDFEGDMHFRPMKDFLPVNTIVYVYELNEIKKKFKEDYDVVVPKMNGTKKKKSYTEYREEIGFSMYQALKKRYSEDFRLWGKEKNI